MSGKPLGGQLCQWASLFSGVNLRLKPDKKGSGLPVTAWTH